jgi:DNA-binding MarR family transcriptional regulator
VPDAVDTVLAQWRRQRPDLELVPMGVVGRLARLMAHLAREIEAGLAAHDLSTAEFDVLAALRRGGEPFEAKPSELARLLMLSPAGMTGRLDRLEQAGHVERRMDPDDRRSYLVRLSRQGLAVVDRAVADHVANEARLLTPLGRRERAQLDDLLRTLLAQFDGELVP